MTTDGQFNLFQRMMLRWRTLHPYNPVHVVRVSQPLDVERLRSSIATQFETSGLTGLVVDHRRGRFRYEGGPEAFEVTVTAAGGDPLVNLQRVIEREFEAPFVAAEREHPFRFFAVDARQAFYLGLTYDHYVASGDSIARVLTDIALAYSGGPRPAQPPLERYPATYRSLFLRRPSWLLHALADLPRAIGRSRRAYRPRFSDIEEARNEFVLLQLTPHQLGRVLRAAKAWGVTLNDLLLALLLQALAPHTEPRRREPRRRGLAVSSIMNMRQDFTPDAHRALSPCLAAFTVVHEVPDGIALRQLAQEVHVETARIRGRHLYVQSLLALAVSGALWPRLTPSRRHRLYAKYHPVWAGVTSLSVNSNWARAGAPGTASLDYLRAVPTGPLCPLVLAATTAHDVLHLGIAYRTTAFSRTTVDALARSLVASIDAIGDAGS